MTKIIIYQNYAYCRLIHIWSLLSLIKITKVSPLISIYIIFIIHNISFIINRSYFTNKNIGILLFDILLIILNIIVNNKIHIYSNLLFFFIYLIILKYYFNISPIKLYTFFLPEDDLKYYDETYIQYKKKIWKLFLINK